MQGVMFMKCYKNKISRIYKTVATASLAFVLALAGPFALGFQALQAALQAVAEKSVENGAASSPATRLAEQIGTRPAAPRRGALDLTITGQIPTANFTGLGMVSFNEELNDRFVAQRDDFIQTHRVRAPDFHFEPEVFISGQFISVVVNMESLGVNISRAVATTVIDTENLEIITLTDFNPNFLQIANNRLDSMIAQNPRLFVTDFAGVDNNHPFYLNDDGLNLPFASGTLRASQRGIETINFSFDSIQDEIIETELFFALAAEQYNTIMVRLGTVAEKFGYDVESEDDAVNLTRDGVLEAGITVGQNAYYRNDEAIALEVAPELRAGEIYVPLSFFREILGIATTVVPGEHILMSQWRNTEGVAATVPSPPDGGQLIQ
jgi:hypothetical protein